MKLNRGSSLVEVIIAAGVVVMALSVMVAAVSASIANNRLSKERAVATRLAQEALEWVRIEKNLNGWPTFDAYLLDTRKYCLNSGITNPTNPSHLPVSNVGIGGNCGNADDVTASKVTYNRNMTLTKTDKDGAIPGNEYIEVKVRVDWIYSNRTEYVEISSGYGRWQ